MSTTNPPARFITPVRILHRQGFLQATLCLVLTGLLFITAACGDFQDPASGAQVASPAQPSVTPVTQQRTGENQTSSADTSTFPAEPAPSLPTPGATQLPNDAPANPVPQPLTREKPQTQPITFEWNPSPSGNAAGYIVRVSTTSAQTNYTFNTGQETRLVVDLPRGESYIATVLAYNIAGESLPANYIRFDLF